MNNIDLALLVSSFVYGNPKIVFRQFEDPVINDDDGVFVRISDDLYLQFHLPSNCSGIVPGSLTIDQAREFAGIVAFEKMEFRNHQDVAIAFSSIFEQFGLYFDAVQDDVDNKFSFENGVVTLQSKKGFVYLKLHGNKSRLKDLSDKYMNKIVNYFRSDEETGDQFFKMFCKEVIDRSFSLE